MQLKRKAPAPAAPMPVLKLGAYKAAQAALARIHHLIHEHPYKFPAVAIQGSNMELKFRPF
eukprot:14029979-Alexandrium_andersonii.AAC.1